MEGQEIAPTDIDLDLDGVAPVRCGYCGRFLGFEAVNDGLYFPFCSNCKHFSIVIRGETEMRLTGQEIYDRLLARTKGQKGPRDQKTKSHD